MKRVAVKSLAAVQVAILALGATPAGTLHPEKLTPRSLVR